MAMVSVSPGSPSSSGADGTRNVRHADGDRTATSNSTQTGIDNRGYEPSDLPSGSDPDRPGCPHWPVPTTSREELAPTDCVIGSWGTFRDTSGEGRWVA